MAQIYKVYKVYINDKPIIFSTERVSKLNSLEFKEEGNEKELITIIEKMEKDGFESGIEVISANSTQTWNLFKKNYRLIEAAGGVVKQNNAILAIFRLGKWDLPKGKMEKGESPKESAIREVEEECGINSLKIIRQLPTIYHTYYIKGERVLKATYWFEMMSDFKGVLKPQFEEDITQVKWVRNKEEIFKNTYASIADLLTFV